MAADYTDWLDGEPILQTESEDGSYTTWIDGEPVVMYADATKTLVIAAGDHLHDGEGPLTVATSGASVTLSDMDAYHLHDAEAIAGLGLATDFSEYSTSAALPDWTERFVTANVSNEVQAASWEHAPGNQVYYDQNANQRSLLSWDKFDSVDADVEMLVLVKSDELLDQGARLYARASGAAASENAYYFNFAGNSTATITKYVAGVATDLTTIYHGWHGDSEAYYFWIRFKVEGTSLKARVWQYDQDEPYDWTLETTDSDISAAGWNGIGAYDGLADSYYYYFACNPGGCNSPKLPGDFATTLSEKFGVTGSWSTALTSSIVYCRALGGMPVDAEYVYGGHAYFGILTLGSTVRMAIYSGGDLSTGPVGATLLADLGETPSDISGAQWVTLLCPKTAVPAGEPLWMAIKGNDGDISLVYNDDEGSAGNWQQATGRWDSATISTDETASFPSTWPADAGGSFDVYWYMMSIMVEPYSTDLVVADCDHLHDADNIAHFPLARYWRVNVTSSFGGSSSQIGSMWGWFDENGDKIDISGLTHYSPHDDAGNPVSNLADEDPTTIQQFTQEQSYCRIDFGSAVTITSVIIQQHTTWNARGPEDFTIDYSNNGSDWETALDCSGQAAWVDHEQRLFSVDPATLPGSVSGYKGWGFKMLSSNDTGYCQIGCEWYWKNSGGTTLNDSDETGLDQLSTGGNPVTNLSDGSTSTPHQVVTTTLPGISGCIWTTAQVPVEVVVKAHATWYGRQVDEFEIVKSTDGVFWIDSGAVYSAGSWTGSQEKTFNVDPWIAEAAHDLVSDNLTITTGAASAENLVLAAGDHLHDGEAVALTQDHDLVVAESYHEHFGDAFALTQDHALVNLDTFHLLVDDGPLSLQVGLTLVTAECHHDLVTDPVSLTQEHTLVVEECHHDHLADNISIVIPLVVNACDNLHEADNITLTALHILTVAECYHAHAGPNLTLGATDLAAAEEAFHLHDSDNIVLTYSVTLQNLDTFHLHDADASVLECGQTLTMFLASGTPDDTDYSYSAGNNRMWYDAKKAFPNQTFCRVQVKSQPSFASDITNMSVGYRKGVVEFGDDFSDTPSIVKFDGSEGYSLSAGSSKWSDWLKFPLADSPTGEILFNVFFDATYYFATWGVYNAQQYKNISAVDDSLTEVVSYSSSNSERIIWEIQVRPPTQTHLVIGDDELLHTADAIPTLNKVIPNIHQAFHDLVSDPVALDQEHFLSALDADHLHFADNLAMWSDLIVAESNHLHFADNIDLVQSSHLVVDESNHLHFADTFPLVQKFSLIVDESAHTHAADNISLSGLAYLALDDCDHLHFADSFSLDQEHALLLEESHHLHFADTFDVIWSADAVLEDGDHLHAADNIVLTQEHYLAVDEASHAVDSDTFWIVQVFTLVIDESEHLTASDTFAFTQEHSLVVAEIAHIHVADDYIGLSQKHYLDMDASHIVHLHFADNILIPALEVVGIPGVNSLTPLRAVASLTTVRDVKSLTPIDRASLRSLTTRHTINSLTNRRLAA